MTARRHYYRLYDLTIESAEPLSLTPAADVDEGADEIWRYEEGVVESGSGELVHSVVDFDGVRRLEVRHRDRGELYFSYGDSRIHWSSSKRLIRLERGDLRSRPAIALERMVAPIAMILGRRDFVALHASAVVDDRGVAWVFAGDSGVGKSTTALGLMRRDLPILADDLVLYDGSNKRVFAATPSLRLFDQPELVPEAIDRELAIPELEKYWYQLPESRRRPTRAPLGAIYSLEPADAVDDPRIEELSGQSSTLPILAQSFDLTDPPAPWRARRFRTLCDLARNTPVFRVIYGRDNRERPVQVELLIRHIETRRGPS